MIYINNVVAIIVYYVAVAIFVQLLLGSHLMFLNSVHIVGHEHSH